MLSTEKNSLDAGMTGLLKNLAVSKKAWRVMKFHHGEFCKCFL